MGFFKDLAAKLMNDEAPQDTSITINDPNAPPGRISWPPRIQGPPRILGEVQDTSGRIYKRDIGRSFQLGGHTYYVFGDTFCFDDSRNFCGTTNNTFAHVPDISRPLESTHFCHNGQAKVPEFVPLSDEEAQYCHHHEQLGENKRFANWTFGGVIEKPGTDGREGWLFYDTVEIHGHEAVRQCGTGVASVTVDTATGNLTCQRVGPFPLRDPEDPLWGNAANIAAPDGYTYLLSGKGLDNFMARIRTDSDFSDPSNYEFLEKGGQWVRHYSGPHGPFGELAHDVLAGQAQGAILYAPDWAPQGRPYMWFGNSKFPMSKLFVGCAATPEGPWEVHEVMEMPRAEPDASNLRYCIYPHVWGSDPGRGQMLISWTDNGSMGGKVFQGIFSFAVE